MSKSDLTISETLSDYWVNFVKFGEPNGGSLPQWTPFTNNTPMVMYFANTPHLGSVPNETQLEVLVRYFKWKFGLQCLSIMYDYDLKKNINSETI